MRRLVEDDLPENVPEPVKSSRISVFKLLIVLPLSLMIFCFLNGTPIMDFTSCYRRQYNEIVYGSCHRQIDTDTLFSKIAQNNILHQKDALDEIALAFHNKTKFLSLTLVGPPGVGKTLFTTALIDNFPWHKNALRYAWNTLVNDETEKFHMLRYFLNSLSECGRNLLIVDNLVPCDKEIVPIVHEMYAQIQAEGHRYKRKEQDEKYLIVIFVFTLNTLNDPETYNQQREMLQVLPNTTTINFRSFEEADVPDCIKREFSIENLTLTETNSQQVLGSINPKISGCRNVNAKVRMYGTSNAEETNVADNGITAKNQTKDELDNA